MGGNSGSTIQARAEVFSHLFEIILLGVIIIAVLGLIYFISRAYSKYVNSPAFIEKKKKRPTSGKDINEVAAACNLEKGEKEVLYTLCQQVKTPNIHYLVKDRQAIDGLLKKLFKEYDLAKNDQAKTNLFSLRKKIFNVYKQKVLIKNTKLIDAGTEFTFTVSKGFHYKLELIENSLDGMILNVPSEIKVETDMPKPLEKISLVFEVKDGAPYTLETRIVRFQNGKDGCQQVILVHSDKISSLTQRAQERADVDFPCRFNSVKTSIEKKGKEEKTIYTPAEKDYDGELEDISTGGCRLCTDLPIKAGQFINIKAPFNGKTEDSAIGTIVRTTKRSDNIFVLHIKFVKIAPAVVNRINAMVIHYDE